MVVYFLLEIVGLGVFSLSTPVTFSNGELKHMVAMETLYGPKIRRFEQTTPGFEPLSIQGHKESTSNAVLLFSGKYCHLYVLTPPLHNNFPRASKNSCLALISVKTKVFGHNGCVWCDYWSG